MQLPAALSWLLIVAGAWNLVVWPQFLRRVMKDPRARDESGRATRFLTVHLFLVAVSMTLGAAVAVVGFRTLLA
ncbi:SCO4848 family membrane protein [Sinomonas halotolerans]|uniref:Integral membrane protein n=1 Tax=Sinomonas halotolerans TaxID=1644133 RepID=A0ABU9WV16_9MICC